MSEDVYNRKNYKNAFKCHKCPGSNGENGCPMWWEYAQEDDKGNVRMVKTCGFAELPFFFKHLITAANRPAEEFGKVGNQITKAVEGIMLSHDRSVDKIEHADKEHENG